MLFPFVVISFVVKKRETNFILEEYGPPASLFKTDIKETEYTIKLKSGSEVKSIPLEEYVIGVVAGEMPASFQLEALKAQAVASRTYALYKKNSTEGEFDLTDGVNNQVYIDDISMRNKWGQDYQKYYDKIKSAVDETKGKVIVTNGEIIEAFYFSMSSGNTNDSETVFGESRSYLLSVVSEYDTNSLKGYESCKEFSKDEFRSKLSLECEDIELDFIERNKSDYVDKIGICSKEFKGSVFRSMLNLRSADFDIEIGQGVKITTHGYGHGVGMSQYGANGYANAGYTYEDIIKHYYTGVEIIDLKDV